MQILCKRAIFLLTLYYQRSDSFHFMTSRQLTRLREHMHLNSCVTSSTKSNGATREVLCADATAWLSITDEPLAGSVFTSMPDISELSGMFKGSLMDSTRSYEMWFTNTAYSIMSRLRNNEYAIFLQSDVRVIDNRSNDVLHWVDKGKLCSVAADKAGCNMMWHKLTLNTKIDKKSVHRPSYSHLVCYGKNTSYNAADFAVPDVVERGHMTWYIIYNI